MESEKVPTVWIRKGPKGRIELTGRTFPFYKENKEWVKSRFSWDEERKKWIQKAGTHASTTVAEFNAIQKKAATKSV